MATIYETEIIKKAINDLKLAPAREKTPNEIAEKILLTYPLTYPYQILSKAAVTLNATTSTVYTTATDKDTYLVSFDLSVVKDATSTSVRSDLNVYPAETNAIISVGRISSLTLTAQASTITKVFPIPMKLARGTAITLTNTTNVANVQAAGTIQFYEVG